MESLQPLPHALRSISLDKPGPGKNMYTRQLEILQSQKENEQTRTSSKQIRVIHSNKLPPNFFQLSHLHNHVSLPKKQQRVLSLPKLERGAGLFEEANVKKR